METKVFFIVLIASVLHALWNSMVKKHDDKVVAVSGIVFGHVPLSILAIIIFPLPNKEVIPYIIISALIHQGYQWYLLTSYQYGDFTKVYPIARGFGPIVATVISISFLGVLLNFYNILSITLVSIGIIFIGLFNLQKINNFKTIKYSLITGLFIGLYSLVDGYGARLNNSAISYISYSFVLSAIIFPITLKIKKQNNIFKRVINKGKMIFWFGGSVSYIVYTIVVWGFTKAPIAMISALRETSILFAIFIGLFYLREKINFIKVASITLIFFGIIGLKLF